VRTRLCARASRPNLLDGNSLLQGNSCSCAGCYPIALVEPGGDGNLGEVDSADGDRGADQRIADYLEDVGFAVLGVKGLAGQAECVGLAGGGDGDGDVGVGQQVAVAIVNLDQDFANMTVEGVRTM